MFHNIPINNEIICTNPNVIRCRRQIADIQHLLIAILRSFYPISKNQLAKHIVKFDASRTVIEVVEYERKLTAKRIRIGLNIGFANFRIFTDCNDNFRYSTCAIVVNLNKTIVILVERLKSKV